MTADAQKLIEEWADQHGFAADHPLVVGLVAEVEGNETDGWVLVQLGKVRHVYERAAARSERA